MNQQQRNILIGITSLIVIIGLVVWVAARSPRETTESAGMMDLHRNQGGDEGSVIQSHRSYHIESNADSLNIAPDEPVDYTFSIVDERGDVTKAFATVHERIMHVIIVRRDLQYFQHVHPTFNEQTGQFMLANLTFPAAGPYRIFADFTPRGTQLDPEGMPLGVTIYEDVVSGDATAYTSEQLGAATEVSAVGEYAVSLATQPATVRSGETAMLTFTVRRNGQVVTDLQPYLGALGHAVVLREGDLQFIHAHPMEESRAAGGTVPFHVVFPAAGMYKVFAQFQHQGEVLTHEFVVSVVAGEEGMPMDREDMMLMDHNSH